MSSQNISLINSFYTEAKKSIFSKEDCKRFQEQLTDEKIAAAVKQNLPFVFQTEQNKTHLILPIKDQNQTFFISLTEKKILNTGTFSEVFSVPDVISGKEFAMKSLKDFKVPGLFLREGISLLLLHSMHPQSSAPSIQSPPYYTSGKGNIFSIFQKYISDGFTFFLLLQHMSPIHIQFDRKYLMQCIKRSSDEPKHIKFSDEFQRLISLLNNLSDVDLDHIRSFGYLKKNVISILQAGKFLTDRGLVHTDIKPENMLVAKDGNIVLSDFEAVVRNESATRLLNPLGTYTEEFIEEQTERSLFNISIEIQKIVKELYQTFQSGKPFNEVKDESIKKIIKQNKTFKIEKPLNEVKNLLIRKIIKQKKDDREIAKLFLRHEMLQESRMVFALGMSLKNFIESHPIWRTPKKSRELLVMANAIAVMTNPSISHYERNFSDILMKFDEEKKQHE